MPTHAHTSMPHSLGSPEGVISKKNVSQMEMFSSYLRQLGASCPARFQQDRSLLHSRKCPGCRDVWYTGGGGEDVRRHGKCKVIVCVRS